MLKSNTSLYKSVLVAMLACSMIIILIPCAMAQDVKVISASPGDTVSFTGTGTPNSQVTLEVSASISVGTTQSGGKYYYKSSMNGLHIPDGNGMSISVSPVDTLTVSGSFPGLPVGMSIDGSVSNHVGTFSKSVPAGNYNIVVSGVANGSPSSVSMTVHASQPQTVGSDGTYTASISTSGLPATVYTVQQNGIPVARVYLGVTAPATSTPAPTPTPSVVTSAMNNKTDLGQSGSTGTSLPGTSTNTTTDTLNMSEPSAIASVPATAATSPYTSAIGIPPIYLVAIALGILIIIGVAYRFMVKKR